ncbi:hypothetical protein SPBRAN_1767 [uncultured Candidatus Thioglobus sp.]|nr:hypothetical protein SPBRAN_1767 [uncultured Candidatus Thioglobus sp.]
MNRFNQLFQKSMENTTCQLYTEMSRLVRLYAGNLLKPEAIVAAGDNLSLLSFADEDQLANDKLGIGTDTWLHISELEQEHDPKPFFSGVRSFYVATQENA